MAIVGHWLPSFLLAHWLPDASVAFFCKLAMLSDAIFGLFLVLRLERVGIYDDWMSSPPAGTQKLIEEWQQKGLWDEGAGDRLQGQGGFGGWTTCCFPLYSDLSYSHSVELMALLAIPIVAFAQLRWKIRFSHAVAIFLILVSHPLMDMVFHDAYFLMGNRSRTRVSLQLWQMPWNWPFTLSLEILCAYGSYRLWLSGREPIKPDEETAQQIRRYKRMFWQLSLGHNMFSWYVFSPVLAWVLYHAVPGGLGYSADTEWSYLMFCVVVWSWTVALYPLYKLETLMVPVRSGCAEAAYVDLKV